MPWHVNKFKISKARRTMNEAFCGAVARILAKTLPILTLTVFLTGAEIAYFVS
jgi:hypothetical protein